MIKYYTLRIHCDEKKIKLLNQLLGIKSNVDYEWAYQVIENENSPYFDYVKEFLLIIEKNKKILDKLNIKNKDIDIWIDFISNGEQCNFELSPAQMKLLCEKDITLCLSYY